MYSQFIYSALDSRKVLLYIIAPRISSALVHKHSHFLFNSDIKNQNIFIF